MLWHTAVRNSHLTTWPCLFSYPHPTPLAQHPKCGLDPRSLPRGILLGCSPSQTPPAQNRNLKKTNCLHVMISKVLRDFPFSINQPLKSADDQYIRILKTKLIKLQKQEDRTLWLSHGTCSYIGMYINAVAGSVMLCLQHDFYNITFKIKHKLYMPQGQPPPPHRIKKFWMRTFLDRLTVQFLDNTHSR
jgi:hypothetical protein